MKTSHVFFFAIHRVSIKRSVYLFPGLSSRIKVTLQSFILNSCFGH